MDQMGIFTAISKLPLIPQSQSNVIFGAKGLGTGSDMSEVSQTLRSKVLKLSSGIIHQPSQVGSSRLDRDPSWRLWLKSPGKKWGSGTQNARVGLWDPGRGLEVWGAQAQVLLTWINVVQAMEFDIAWQRDLTSWLLRQTCCDNNLIWLFIITVQGDL